MNNKIRIARLIMTALIISLAAILTTLAPRNAEAAPPQPSTNFDAIDSYVGERLDELRMPGAALGIVERSCTSRRSAMLMMTEPRWRQIRPSRSGR